MIINLSNTNHEKEDAEPGKHLMLTSFQMLYMIVMYCIFSIQKKELKYTKTMGAARASYPQYAQTFFFVPGERK